MTWHSKVYVIEYTPNKWLVFSEVENKIWIYRKNRITRQYSPTKHSRERLILVAIESENYHNDFLDRIGEG